MPKPDTEAMNRRAPSPMIPRVPKTPRLPPGTLPGLDTIEAIKAADDFEETPPRGPTLRIKQRQERYDEDTRGARPPGAPNTEERVRLVKDSSPAPEKPSFLRRAYEGCVGALCGRKKTEGGRRRRHHKGSSSKKTLKRTRRHRHRRSSSRR